LPAGTKVLLQLRSPIDTKSAHPGDGVYCQTAFPVTQDNILVIPAGTYVKGKIMNVQRAGRIKGRAEIQVHFTTLIYPNGYSVDLPGSLDSTPGAQHHTVSDKEGTVKADGQKGKDAGEVATWGGSGAAVGALSTGTLKGAGIGGGIGSGIGLIKVLSTRGQDVRLESGSSLEMVLQRPLTLDISPATTAGEVVPRGGNTALPLPPRSADDSRQRPRMRRIPLP
jgi:type IV secretion system protein VirB10